MTEDAPLSTQARERIVDEAVTRFYVRLGVILVVILVVASIIVWTGAFEWMLTVGDRGILSAEDILGFLSFMIWALSIGVLVILFTLKRTLTRVEVDVQARDQELDAQVKEQEARLRQLLSKAEERMRAEHGRLVAVSNESRQGDEAVLLMARKEIDRQMATVRKDFVEYITKLHEQWAATQEAPAPPVPMKAERASADRSMAPRLARLLGEETRLLRETRDEHHARLRAIEEGRTETSRSIQEQERRLDATAEDLQSRLESLEARAERQRQELLARIDAKVHETVAVGVQERIHQAVEIAFRPGRFYRLLGVLLAGGIVLVLLLAFFGITGPGLFTVRTATFGLALACSVLAIALFALIWSFTDAVKTLRAFAGSRADEPPRADGPDRGPQGP